MGRWLKPIETFRIYKRVELRLQQGVPLCSILRNLDLTYNKYNAIKRRVQRTFNTTDGRT